MWRLPHLLIVAYRRLLSPLLPPVCRFHPSCSRYADEALFRHGLWRGSWLTFRRILRCNPWHPGGYDPVPGRVEENTRSDLGILPPGTPGDELHG